MKTVLMVIVVIFAYIGISLFMYMIATRLNPYNPDNDPYDDGDYNKVVATLWPITLPLFVISCVAYGISKIYDALRKDLIDR